MSRRWPALITGATPGPGAPEQPIAEHGAERPAEIDDELDAQKECYDALAPLTAEARARVLRWLGETLEAQR